MATRAFLHIKRPLVLVDATSEMARRQGHALMRHHFEAGGDMKTIVQWLSQERGVVRRHGRNDVLKNLLDAAIATGQTLEDIVDAALVQPAQEERRKYWLPSKSWDTLLWIS